MPTEDEAAGQGQVAAVDDVHSQHATTVAADLRPATGYELAPGAVRVWEDLNEHVIPWPDPIGGASTNPTQELVEHLIETGWGAQESPMLQQLHDSRMQDLATAERQYAGDVDAHNANIERQVEMRVVSVPHTPRRRPTPVVTSVSDVDVRLPNGAYVERVTTTYDNGSVVATDSPTFQRRGSYTETAFNSRLSAQNQAPEYLAHLEAQRTLAPGNYTARITRNLWIDFELRRTPGEDGNQPVVIVTATRTSFANDAPAPPVRAADRTPWNPYAQSVPGGLRDGPAYSQEGARTGRISASEPNLQRAPARRPAVNSPVVAQSTPRGINNVLAELYGTLTESVPITEARSSGPTTADAGVGELDIADAPDAEWLAARLGHWERRQPNSDAGRMLRSDMLEALAAATANRACGLVTNTGGAPPPLPLPSRIKRVQRLDDGDD